MKRKKGAAYMRKNFTVVLFSSILTLNSLWASNAGSEILLATALEPPKTISLATAPIPALPDLNYEELAVASVQILPPLRLPSFGATISLEKTLFDVNLVAMVGLNVADYVSTRAALKYQGLSEWNPLMKPFVKSPVVFAAAKIGTTALAYWSFKALFKHSRTLAWVMTTASNGLLSYVLANNLHMIQVARSR
jgi:hypothetical protein